jgi:bile acid:Na+ symporter, BASS family
MQRIAIASLVVVMMTAIGLRTELSDFRGVWRSPLGMVLAVFANTAVIPLIAIVATAWLPLPPEVRTALLICAASPGGPTGPLFAGAAGGHLATAVTAMVTLSLLSVFTAPPTLSLALTGSEGLDSSSLLGPMLATLLLFQLLPLVAGMALRWGRPALASRLAGPANAIANALLLAVIVGLLATKVRVLLSVGAVGIAACVALVLANLAVGALASPAGRARRSLSMIAGVRSISLALLISAACFPAPLVDATILTFGLFTMLVPFALSRWLGRSAGG